MTSRTYNDAPGPRCPRSTGIFCGSMVGGASIASSWFVASSGLPSPGAMAPSSRGSSAWVRGRGPSLPPGACGISSRSVGLFPLRRVREETCIASRSARLVSSTGTTRPAASIESLPPSTTCLDGWFAPPICPLMAKKMMTMGASSGRIPSWRKRRMPSEQRTFARRRRGRQRRYCSEHPPLRAKARAVHDRVSPYSWTLT